MARTHLAIGHNPTVVTKAPVFNASVANFLRQHFVAHVPPPKRNPRGERHVDLDLQPFLTLIPPAILRSIHDFVQSTLVRPVCFYDGWARWQPSSSGGLRGHMDEEHDEVSVVLQLTPGAFLFVVQGLRQVEPEPGAGVVALAPPTHLDAGEAIVYHGSTHVHGCRPLQPHEERWQMTLFYTLQSSVTKPWLQAQHFHDETTRRTGKEDLKDLERRWRARTPSVRRELRRMYGPDHAMDRCSAAVYRGRRSRAAL